MRRTVSEALAELLRLRLRLTSLHGTQHLLHRAVADDIQRAAVAALDDEIAAVERLLTDAEQRAVREGVAST